MDEFPPGAVMLVRRPLLTVLALSAAAIAVGFSRSPLWDEDEPRFAAVARSMLETGDWIVPRYNETLAVDKPVLMHWAMAAAFSLFGVNEFAARLPAAVAALATALAVLRAGTRWFDSDVGVVAALAFVGCLLVGIESHAATPDAILVACVTWATVLSAEGIVRSAGSARRLPLDVCAATGGLMGLAVLCKGPVGFVGPMGVLWLWTAWLEYEDRRTPRPSVGGRLSAAFRSLLSGALRLRPAVTTLAMLAVAAPWYAAVSIRTGGAWPAGFFLVHNVGRFAAPMEQHSGGILYHPLAMLVGFYPWSCFLPLAVVLPAWRIWNQRDGSSHATRAADKLLLCWFVIWIGAFSVAATKLPNYVLPAYPAAAMLVARLGTDAVRLPGRTHPGWMACGMACLGLGGIATAGTVLVAARFGLTGAEPAAAVGIVPVVGSVACFALCRRNRPAALAAMVITGLAFTAIAVGPAGTWIARANTLPGLVEEAGVLRPGHRLAVFGFYSPNAVFYSPNRVTELTDTQRDEAVAFLRSGIDAVMIVREDDFDPIKASLPPEIGVLARRTDLFRQGGLLLVGTKRTSTARGREGGFDGLDEGGIVR